MAEPMTDAEREAQIDPKLIQHVPNCLAHGKPCKGYTAIFEAMTGQGLSMRAMSDELRAKDKELREARAEIARLSAPPGASAIERAAQTLAFDLRAAYPHIIKDVARAIEQAGREATAREREQIAAWLDCPKDCRFANAAGTCQRTDELCSHYVAESIRLGEKP